MEEQDHVSIKEVVSIRMTTIFSTIHLMSAQLFTAKAREIEEQFVETGNREKSDEYLIFCSNAVLCSVSFLEATINEFFCGVRDERFELKKAISPEIFAVMRNMWELGTPRTAGYSIMEKYDIALVLAQKQPFVRGSRPYQDVYRLIQLRNALVHYESEMIEIGVGMPPTKESNTDKFERSLHGLFNTNPFCEKEPVFFPNRCLSYGCAKWAVENVILFVDAFNNKMGIAPNYEAKEFRNSLV